MLTTSPPLRGPQARAAIAAVFLAVAASARAEVVESANFVIDAPDRATALRVAFDAERTKADAERFWAFPSKPFRPKVPVVVEAGAPDPNGSEAEYGTATVLIRAWAWHGADAEAIVPHEVVHAVISRNAPGGWNAARWVHEGMATAFEVARGDYPRRFRDAVGRTPLRLYLGWKNFPFGLNGDALYGQAASLCLYLRDNWGPEAVWSFYLAGTRDGFDVAAVTVLGVDLDSLERDWLDSLTSLESPYPKSLRGTNP